MRHIIDASARQRCLLETYETDHMTATNRIEITEPAQFWLNSITFVVFHTLKAHLSLISFTSPSNTKKHLSNTHTQYIYYAS